jgi:hypothetical protein
LSAGRWLALTGAALLAGCELAEVAAPRGEDVLVVESVLEAGARRQYLLLHRSLDGRVIRGEAGARVVVSDAAGLVVAYDEVETEACLVDRLEEIDIEDLEIRATCYASPVAAGRFVSPGRTYDLRVETDRGEVLRGRTTVPREFRINVPAIAVDPTTRSARCRLPSTPFRLTWTQAAGAWAYVVSLRLSRWGEELRAQGVEVPDPLQLTGVSVSAADTTLAFPGDIGLFQRFDFDQRVFLTLQRGLPVEADAVLVVLAADRNYVNAIRGGRVNPSGNIRGSSVVGDGVGLFGSVVPLTIRSPSDSTASDLPRCPMP